MKSLIARPVTTAFWGAVLSGFALPATAQELVVDGDFTQTNYVVSDKVGGKLGTTLFATGWSNTIYSGTTAGYNFLVVPGTADDGGPGGYLTFWGSHNGGLDAFTAPPNGGNFIAADGAYQTAAIQQTITGLTIGDSYTVTFEWAAAQQSGFSGNTTEAWQVSLGDETNTTDIYDLASHGFSGWMDESFTYTATGDSEVLSFLAKGTPNGEPPFSLLADVSMDATATPEPSAAQYGALLLAAPFAIRGLRTFLKKARA